MLKQERGAGLFAVSQVRRTSRHRCGASARERSRLGTYDRWNDECCVEEQSCERQEGVATALQLLREYPDDAQVFYESLRACRPLRV